MAGSSGGAETGGAPEPLIDGAQMRMHGLILTAGQRRFLLSRAIASSRHRRGRRALTSVGGILNGARHHGGATRPDLAQRLELP